jgi:class 3 adenylate cyclase/tetratricopeptide (TPR) repeat protein
VSNTRINTIIENFSKYQRVYRFENEFFERLYSLYEKGKYNSILEQIDDCSSSEKDFFNFRILKFHVLVESGKYNEVEALLDDFKDRFNSNNTFQQFQYLLVKAFLFLKQSKSEECHNLINKLESIRDTIPESEDYLTMEALGNFYRIKGLLNSYPGLKLRLSPEELMETHERGLAVFHNSKNLLGIARQHNNLGRVFIIHFQNFETGFIFLEQALAMRTFLGHEGEIAGSLNLLGLNYASYGEYDLALEYLLKAKETRMAMGNIDNIIISLLNLGYYHFSVGEYEKGIEYAQEARKLLKKNPNNFYEFVLNFALFLVYAFAKDVKNMRECRQLFIKGAKLLDNPSLEEISEKLGSVINRHSKRVKKKAKAIYMLEELSEENSQTFLNIYNLNSFIINQILDHLFEEFKESEDIEIIEEFDTWLNKLERINSDHRGVLDVARAKLLKSKLLLLEFKIEDAKSLLQKTMNEFENRGVHKFSVLFSNEMKKLLEEEHNWKLLKESNAPLSERIDFTNMDEIIESSSIQKNVRDIVSTHKSIFEQREKAVNLLHNVLPKEIIPFLHEKNEPYIESFESISVLFADVVGFTKLSQKLSPKIMVESLNEIFGFFDSLLEKYDAEKIRTIGDNYMLCIGAPRKRMDHAILICRLALDIMSYIVDRKKNGDEFNFRIGVNSGSAVGGVIGTTKYHFDIWSNAVNIASRMESTGIPGKIQITKDTYKIVKNNFITEKRGKIDIKGKGEMETYFLISEKAK